MANDFVPNIKSHQDNVLGLTSAFQSTNGTTRRVPQKDKNIIVYEYLDEYGRVPANSLKCTHNIKNNSTEYSYWTSGENIVAIHVIAYDYDSDGTIDRYETVDEDGDETEKDFRDLSWYLSSFWQYLCNRNWF